MTSHGEAIVWQVAFDELARLVLNAQHEADGLPHLLRLVYFTLDTAERLPADGSAGPIVEADRLGDALALVLPLFAARIAGPREIAEEAFAGAAHLARLCARPPRAFAESHASGEFADAVDRTSMTIDLLEISYRREQLRLRAEQRARAAGRSASIHPSTLH